MDGETIDIKPTNDILLSILSLLERQQEEDEAEKNVWQASYPNDGTQATLAAGTTVLDFEAGTVIDTAGAVTMMSSSLRRAGVESLRSASIFVDQDVVVQFDSHDKIFQEANTWMYATDNDFLRIQVTCTVNTTFQVMVSSGEGA